MNVPVRRSRNESEELQQRPQGLSSWSCLHVNDVRIEYRMQNTNACKQPTHNRRPRREQGSNTRAEEHRTTTPGEHQERESERVGSPEGPPGSSKHVARFCVV